MRDLQVRGVDGEMPVEEDVDVQFARTPPLRVRLAAGPGLDRLALLQQLARRQVGVDLDDLVEELWLLHPSHRFGLLHRRLRHHLNAFGAEPRPGEREVGGTVTEVGAEAEVGPHAATSGSFQPPRTMASVIRATRTIASTSWTRTT